MAQAKMPKLVDTSALAAAEKELEKRGLVQKSNDFLDKLCFWLGTGMILAAGFPAYKVVMQWFGEKLGTVKAFDLSIDVGNLFLSLIFFFCIAGILLILKSSNGEE